MFLHLSVILFTEEVSASVHAGIHAPWADTDLGRHPSGRHPSRHPSLCRHPLGRHHPGRHPSGRHPGYTYHTIQWDIQRNIYPPDTHPGPYHPVGHPKEVAHLLHIHVHTIPWDIQKGKLLTYYTSRSRPSSMTSRGTFTHYTSRSIPSSRTSRGTFTYLLRIQVHTIQWDIQRNSYSPATHPGPYHLVDYPEEQLLTCYTSGSISSNVTSRGTVTHLLHIQVHTIQ